MFRSSFRTQAIILFQIFLVCFINAFTADFFFFAPTSAQSGPWPFFFFFTFAERRQRGGRSNARPASRALCASCTCSPVTYLLVFTARTWITQRVRRCLLGILRCIYWIYYMAQRNGLCLISARSHCFDVSFSFSVLFHARKLHCHWSSAQTLKAKCRDVFQENISCRSQWLKFCLICCRV